MALPAPHDPLTALLLTGLVLSRGLDFFSTWVVTPGLTLEANPLMRRWRWARMGAANLLLLGLPFLHHGLAMTFIVTSLLVAGTNLTAGALSRGLGEREQWEQQRRAVRRMGLAGALALNSLGSLTVCAGGGVLLLAVRPAGSLAWWGALGVVMFGATGLVHLNLAIWRLHRADA